MSKKIMDNELKEISIRCDCGAHYLTLSYWPEGEEKPMVFLTVQIQELPFWLRLKWALKLLFNKCRDWEEFHIDDKYKLEQLKKFIEEIEKSL